MGARSEKQTAREERLEAALRENLKRRKAQTRGRASGDSDQAARTDQDRADAPKESDRS